MILYHYTTGQGLFGIIDSGKLHCSNIHFLNDPSEEIYFKEVLREVLQTSEECNTIHEELFNSSLYDHILSPTDNFVASFSKNGDSLSMWNYYSSGNGYNIGIDINSLIESHSSPYFGLRKIELVYDRELQKEKAIALIESFKTDYYLYKERGETISRTQDENVFYDHSADQSQVELEYNSKIFELGLTFKHSAYEREEEVRLLVSPNPNSSRFECYKVSRNGVFVEYLTLDLKLEEHIKSVTVHPLNGDLHQRGVDKFIDSRISGNTLKSARSSIPFRVI